MAEEVASVVAESSAENPDAPPRPQMRHVRMTRDGVEVLFLHASSLGVAKSDVEGLVGIFISCPSEIDVGMFVALIPEKAREVAKSLTDAAAEIEMGHTVH
jgi:hypothetical protein